MALPPFSYGDSKLRIDPNIRPPRKTRTAYVFFIQENFPKVARNFETRNPQPIIRHLAQMWRDLPEKEKQRYRNRQKNDHERYINMRQKFYKAYRMRPPRMFRRGLQRTSHRGRKAFVLFEIETYDLLRLQHSEWNETEIDAEMAKKWNCLEPAQRSVYIRSALDNKPEFDRRWKEYRLLKSRRALNEHMKNGLIAVGERNKQASAENAIQNRIQG